jgi:small subunit ribosomal protein S11
MGKKRVVKPAKEALIKERETVDEKIKRELARLKVKKALEGVRLYLKSSYNNLIATLTDEKGNVIFWSSAGKLGFTGTKKGTPFAATQVAQVMASVIQKLKAPKVEVFVKGIGQGREAALQALVARDLNIVSIADVTPIPHDGPRPKKPKNPAKK